MNSTAVSIPDDQWERNDVLPGRHGRGVTAKDDSPVGAIIPYRAGVP